MQESFWHIFGQNPLSSYWDIVIFMFCAIFSNSSHLGIPNCNKIQQIHTRKILAQRRINFNQWVLRNCHFCVYAIFSNSPWWPSWIVNLHKYEIVRFRDHCDQIWTKCINILKILAFEQNWTCKHKVGHCDLILLCFFYFHNFEYQGQIYNQLYLMVPEKKLILMVLLFLETAAILDSWPHPNL